MLSSPSTRPSSSDLSFFSKSKSTKHVLDAPPVVVTTRLVTVHRPKQSTPPQPPQRTLLSTSSAALSAASSSKKRKQSEVAARTEKKQKIVKAPLHKSRTKSSTPSSSRTPARQRTTPPAPEPIYRHSRSRSTSIFNHVETPVPPPRRCWIEEDGAPGEQFHSCEVVVKRLMRSYKAYFRNPADPADTSFEPHPTNYPVVELEYPNSLAIERFILLAPRDKDHYNPIMCLEKTLYTIIEYYLTPEQQALFGPIPSGTLSTPQSSPAPSPSPSPPSSQGSNASSVLSSAPSLTPQVNYLRTIQRSIHCQDGPLFVSTLATINSIMRSIKYPAVPSGSVRAVNPLKEVVKSWDAVPKKVMLRILDETYQRAVGPNVGDLKRYEAFSSAVYGELMPSFTSDIVRMTHLNSKSLFLDLGSGVGNIATQASLESGCTSFGIEIMAGPAKIAGEQLEHFKTRCRMWGVSAGEVELVQGDMVHDPRVTELMSKADVVLINNKVFEQSLNESLRPKFLDMKEGAILISLKPFVSSLNARLTERNLDDISAIFDVTERPYLSGSVSWGSGGGSYYLHRVDREGYANIKQRFEISRASSRSGRSRR